MNTQNRQSDEPARQHRRHRHFIDASIQGRLLVALIGLELVLFASAMVWLYLDLSAIIEGNLYRIHYADAGGHSPFLASLVTIIPAILLANLLALWLADVIWRAYVRRIVNQLRRILERISKLDLSERQEDKSVQHEVIDRARKWLAYERKEFQAIKNAVETLPDTIDFSDEKELNRAKGVLRELQTLF